MSEPTTHQTYERFHSFLSTLTGCKNIYYQPPSNVKMKYPCIVYSDSPWDTKFANDKPYVVTRHYQVTVIDKLPDNPWTMLMATHIPMCTHERHYTRDGLNHDVLDVYY